MVLISFNSGSYRALADSIPGISGKDFAALSIPTVLAYEVFLLHPLGVCQTTVNMEDTVFKHGLPSTVTVVTLVTQELPVMTVSTHSI